MYFLKKMIFFIFLSATFTLLLLLLPQLSLACPLNPKPQLQFGSTGPYVQLLQMNLNGVGNNFNNFGIDGIFGSKTQQAVGNYQDEYKLPRDGIVGSTTWKVLTDNVKAVQRQLNSFGYHIGNCDGWLGQKTISALKKFQKVHGLYPDGVINPRTRQKLFNPDAKDNFEYRPTSNSLDSLNPYVRQLAKKFLALTRANHMDVRILAAFRSWDEQDRLYEQGRTKPGDVVTNARGGESFHNWGLAFDAAPFENGVISKDLMKFKEMGKLGVQAGLEWGGNFKDIIDLPHFQFTCGLNAEDFLNGVRPRI